MREIKFRGLDKDGKWHYGFYYESHYCSDGLFPTIKPSPFTTIRVDRKSIGQLTGLKDKNGVDIYEGDIVSAWSDGYNHKGEIRFRLEGQPSYIIYPAFANQGFWKIHGSKNRKTGEYFDDGVEVIGNIHENKDLLSQTKNFKP